MNKVERVRQRASYDSDFARWSTEQSALIRQGRFDELDRANVAEEIESLGRSERREIENRLKVLLLHLLKWRFQTQRQKGGWRTTIREQRVQIAKVVRDSPSLRSHPAEVLGEEYRTARADAADETGLPEATFPADCPFSIEQILDPDFLPDQV